MEQLRRAGIEIRMLYSATPEERASNAANLAKLRADYRIRANILGRG